MRRAFELEAKKYPAIHHVRIIKSSNFISLQSLQISPRNSIAFILNDMLCESNFGGVHINKELGCG